MRCAFGAQAEETEEQHQLSAEQADKAEQLIRELREQNEKGEAYFEREKDALQAQVWLFVAL